MIRKRMHVINQKFKHNVSGWGRYGAVLEVNAARPEEGACLPNVELKFKSQHQVKGDPCVPLEIIALPLLGPEIVSESSPTLSDRLDVSNHMQNFYLYNYEDAFCTMSHVLHDNFHFGQGKKKNRNAVHMWRQEHFMETLKYKKCEYTHLGPQTKGYISLLSDVIHDIPPSLLADLLHEELVHQREQEQFSERTTGGAIEYIPFSSSSTVQQGCLVYPGKASLNFHRVAWNFQEEKPPCFDLSPTPLSFQLSGTVRQISRGDWQDKCHVGVRSDYLCGVWCVSERLKPINLEVIQTKQPATCLQASPHVQGELVVANESGAAYLWTLGKGLQRFRNEDSNLYFNAKSSWRWCDFSGHPRVMVYADRSGVELTDIRDKDHCSHTLFRIGQTPDCKSGERVILTKYLKEAHTFHHLITTQHAAYIMDERFPCLPMIKWNHMMEYPPLFAQVVAGSPSGSGTTKVLLGSQRSQEVMLLQYSGGREEACVRRGTPRALPTPRHSLKHLPVHLPHLRLQALDRLTQHAAGLTFIHHNQGKEDFICVLQLTEVGDVFTTR
ncbi:hypothetical protein UPYG_G00351660 [Umbra pygmaea]|uniref:TAF1C beta-propeller domain-containing protein n=1 Tax=Umbra pygmaea TaxID=75934 RepID=A0ABD0W2M5_UMBPY